MSGDPVFYTDEKDHVIASFGAVEVRWRGDTDWAITVRPESKPYVGLSPYSPSDADKRRATTIVTNAIEVLTALGPKPAEPAANQEKSEPEAPVKGFPQW